MKVLVGTFNQEKALVGASSLVIAKSPLRVLVGSCRVYVPVCGL